MTSLDQKAEGFLAGVCHWVLWHGKQYDSSCGGTQPCVSCDNSQSVFFSAGVLKEL